MSVLDQMYPLATAVPALESYYVTYALLGMPPRETRESVIRVSALNREHALMIATHFLRPERNGFDYELGGAYPESERDRIPSHVDLGDL